VLKAYLDASGTDPSQKIVAVSGFATNEQRWTQFEKEWSDFLREVGLTRWHNTDFYTKRGEYALWGEHDARRLFAPRRISEIINAARPFGIGASVRYADWDPLRAAGKVPTDESALGFCLDHCLAALIHRLHEMPDEGIAIYVDRDENENLAREITDWHIEYYQRNEENANPYRDINLRFGSDRQFIPLQAADILANETFRYAHKQSEIPFLGTTLVDSSDPNASMIIELIKNQSFLIVQLFDHESLELEIDARAHGDVRVDGRATNAELRAQLRRERRARGLC
jgi:hypothetical protein